MSTHHDPAWIGIASKAYGACLLLYPHDLREAHGDEMRQAFRDRCREVARGERSAWRWLATELAPDLVSSVIGAHAASAAPGRDSRIALGLLLLAALAVALSTQPLWSGRVLDGQKALVYRWNAAAEARESKRYAAVVAALSDALAARPGDLGRAEAALLHRTLYDQRSVWFATADKPRPYTPIDLAEGARAATLADVVVRETSDPAALALAIEACIAPHCDVDLGLRRLLARDPENALAWMLEFKRASQLGDLDRMSSAVVGTAGARRYDSHSHQLHRDVFATARERAPDDATLLQDAATQAREASNIVTDDFTNDLRYHCSLRIVDGPHFPRWIDTHPQARQACIHLAGLLAGSTDVGAANWGWRQLRFAGTPSTPARDRAMRDATWWAAQYTWQFGIVRKPDGRGYWPWSSEAWHRWADAWAPADGEIPAIRRWLRTSGVPEHAPPDFEVDHPGAWRGKRTGT